MLVSLRRDTAIGPLTDVDADRDGGDLLDDYSIDS
jgi:hypothetical protein